MDSTNKQFLEFLDNTIIPKNKRHLPQTPKKQKEKRQLPQTPQKTCLNALEDMQVQGGRPPMPLPRRINNMYEMSYESPCESLYEIPLVNADDNGIYSTVNYDGKWKGFM